MMSKRFSPVIIGENNACSVVGQSARFAAASAALFLCRLTKGFTEIGGTRRTLWRHPFATRPRRWLVA